MQLQLCFVFLVIRYDIVERMSGRETQYGAIGGSLAP